MRTYSTALLLSIASAMTSSAFEVDRIDPPHWWAGMADTTLQLQISGKDVREASFEIEGTDRGIKIDSIARLNGSNDYLFVYLNISEAKPQTLKFKLTEGKQQTVVDYRLLERTDKGGAQGFSSADVLYMVMPDRFADGDTTNNLVATMRHPVGAVRSNLNLRHGGDLKGIRDHIDYLDTLGITALWLNPVLENDMPFGSYHGYATTDYYRVDPRFGSNGDYAELVKALHDRGIKTVMDMIFNHSGSGHPWFDNPPSTDWFNYQNDYHQTNYRLSTITDPYASEYDKRLSVDGWFVADMPDLNQRNPHLMKYLIQNSIWWIEEVGIDGIRMDTYPYADLAAMGQWCDDVLKEYPQFNIVGECWFGTPSGVARWQTGSKLAKDAPDTHLPTIMDFPFMILSRELKPYTEDTDPWNGLNKVYDHFALDYIYPDPTRVMRFLDNHDTERMILEEPSTLDSWKQAVTILLTTPGIPQIYYGTELLMSGDRKPGDGNVRRDMPGGFPGDSLSCFSAEGRSDLQIEAFDYLSKLMKWRKNASAIHSGRMKHYMPVNGLYVYERSDEKGNRAIIVMNGRDSEVETDIARYVEIMKPGDTFTEILSGKDFKVEDRLKLEPREILILEPNE